MAWVGCGRIPGQVVKEVLGWWTSYWKVGVMRGRAEEEKLGESVGSELARTFFPYPEAALDRFAVPIGKDWETCLGSSLRPDFAATPREGSL